MAILLAASVFAIFKVFSASIDISNFGILSGKAMPVGVRLITPFFNMFGTVALVGGAIYSAWIF